MNLSPSTCPLCCERLAPAPVSVLDGLVAPMNGSEPVGEVSLLRPGSVTQAPSGPANAEVHGEPAWFVDDPSGRLAGGLYWEYAPDALAALHMRPPEIPMATFVAIAENVTFVDPYPARLPYRLDFMPADLRPISLGSGRNGGRYALVFANDLGDVESEDGHPREVHISILDNRPVPTDALWPGYTTLPWQPPTAIGAHRVRCAEAPGGLNFDERQMCELEIQGDILIIDAVELSPTGAADRRPDAGRPRRTDDLVHQHRSPPLTPDTTVRVQHGRGRSWQVSVGGGSVTPGHRPRCRAGGEGVRISDAGALPQIPSAHVR